MRKKPTQLGIVADQAAPPARSQEDHSEAKQVSGEAIEEVWRREPWRKELYVKAISIIAEEVMEEIRVFNLCRQVVESSGGESATIGTIEITIEERNQGRDTIIVREAGRILARDSDQGDGGTFINKGQWIQAVEQVAFGLNVVPQ